ncbi:hypothetical protein [[Kitasatospora] papulosa]|uniref:hypothetical protein n=1 Tax=[Kitasatospora] papulosa TaxID=1464011 RepID=UPI0036CAD9EF
MALGDQGEYHGLARRERSDRLLRTGDAGGRGHGPLCGAQQTYQDAVGHPAVTVVRGVHGGHQLLRVGVGGAQDGPGPHPHGAQHAVGGDQLGRDQKPSAVQVVRRRAGIHRLVHGAAGGQQHDPGARLRVLRERDTGPGEPLVPGPAQAVVGGAHMDAYR